MVFESGTATAVHNTSGVGVGFNDSGSIGLGVGGAQTTSLSVSALAASVAPPEPKKGETAFFVVAGLFLIPLFTQGHSDIGAKIGMVILSALFAFGGFRIRKWNQTKYPPMIAEWEKSWKCLSCGHGFIPE